MTLRDEGKRCCLGKDQTREGEDPNGITVRERNSEGLILLIKLLKVMVIDLNFETYRINVSPLR